jgi:DNA-binding NarL/FixJ family response regulator
VSLSQPEPLGAILIVEDHELTIAVPTERLTKAFPSERIHAARGAREALRKVAEVAPTVIVLDLRLPDGSGFDLMRDIAAQASDVDIVVYSTHDSQVFQDESSKAGAGAFVSKKSVGDLVPVLGRFIACSTCSITRASQF